MSPSWVARRTCCNSGVTRSTNRDYGDNHPCPTLHHPRQNLLQRTSTCNYWSCCKPAFHPASEVPEAAVKQPQGSRGRWAHLAEVEGLHAVGDPAVGAVPRGCDAASWRLPAHWGHWLALTAAAAAQDACKMPQAQSTPPLPTALAPNWLFLSQRLCFNYDFKWLQIFQNAAKCKWKVNLSMTMKTDQSFQNSSCEI